MYNRGGPSPEAALEILARDVLARLSEGRDVTAALAAVGEAEPPRAVGALGAAAADPQLGPHAERWLPAVLESARPARALEALRSLVEACSSAGAPPPPTEGLPLLARLLGCSDFLGQYLLREPRAAADFAGALPPAPEGPAEDAGWDDIRTAKYRGLLRVAARDLANRPFADGLRELSDLADRSLEAGLARAAAETEVAPLSVFALGKLGGRELNFSSDVDLLCLYEAGDRDDLARNQSAARLVQRLKRELERPTPHGFAYRVDLDLRPEGVTGVLANSVDAALGYYETFGAEWERQALVRLRPVAGPRPPAERFMEEAAPFVWRRSIGPEVLGRVAAMKLRIERERRASGRELERELKEGPGGIRDVEFLVQALQLLYGGRDRSLRSGNVLAALDALAAASVLDADLAQELRRDYTWLRRAEHALQLEGERQLHRLPDAPADQRRLARRMGYAHESGEDARTAFLSDLARVQASVRRHFGALVLEPGDLETPSRPDLETQLRRAAEDTPFAEGVARAIPDFTEAHAAPPGAADDRVALGLARALATAPELSRFLAQRPALQARIARLAPGDLATLHEGALPEPADLEGYLDALRVRRREASLLVACLDLGGAIEFEQASRALSALAEATVRDALVAAQATAGRGRDDAFTVVAMGKLGGSEFSYHSDLDVVFLYQADPVVDPEAAAVASRVGQRLIAYLTTMTRAGVAYSVDARLRPSGNQGALVASFAGFESYQRERAEIWEHLALVRARAIAGSVELASKQLDEVRARIAERRESPWAYVADMRGRVERERAADPAALYPKVGAGGLMDAEFLAEGALLELGADMHCPPTPSVPALLEAAVGDAARGVLAPYGFVRRFESRLRFVTGQGSESVARDDPRLPTVAALVAPELAAAVLLERVDDAMREIRAGFDRVVAAGTIRAL